MRAVPEPIRWRQYVQKFEVIFNCTVSLSLRPAWVTLDSVSKEGRLAFDFLQCTTPCPSLSFLFYFMYIGVCMYVCVRCWIPWNWSYKQLWQLGIETQDLWKSSPCS